MLTVYYSGLEHLLPNHNKTLYDLYFYFFIFLEFNLQKFSICFSRPKDNNINSIILTTEIIGVNGPLKLNEFNFNNTFNKPINLFFTYFNVN